MAPDKSVRQGERRFTKVKVAKRIQDLKDAAGLPFNLDSVKELTTEEIKRDIPKLAYEAMWMSFQILIHEHLRSKDPKKKKDAASEFVTKLADSAFIKNLALLKEEGKPEKDKKAKAEWGK